ncbi:MAG: hypothetical protein ACLGI6_16445 [Gammaproteobacteria bacterium]
MKTPVSTILTPMRVPPTTAVAAALYLCWWLGTFPFQVTTGGLQPQYLLFPASVLAVVFVANQMCTLEAAMQVMWQRRLPPEFCHRTARDSYLQMAAAHAFLVVSVALQVAIPKTALQVTTAAAILSVLSTATWLAGMLSRRMARVGFVAGLALGVLAVSQPDRLPGMLQRLDALPSAALVLLTLLWPALLGCLAARPGALVPRQAAVRRSDSVFGRLTHLHRRITFLTLDGMVRKKQPTAFGGQQAWCVVLLDAWVFLLPAHHALSQIWFPALWVVLVAVNLPAFDLHWRHVLSPGGWRRANIGWRLWISSFLVYAAVIGAMDRIRNLFGVLSGQASTWPSPLGIAVACTELGLLIALAVLLRGLVRDAWIIVALTIGSLLSGFIPIHDQAWLVALRHMAAYPLVLIAATVAAIVAANRAWNVDRLIAAARG